MTAGPPVKPVISTDKSTSSGTDEPDLGSNNREYPWE